MFGSDSEDEEVEVGSRMASNGVMAFHNGTEEAMFIYLQNKLSTNSQSAAGTTTTTTTAVLDLVDEYCFSRHWMMHMGPDKRQTLDDALQLIPHWDDGSTQHVLILELGSYCGYSTSYLAQALARRDARNRGCVAPPSSTASSLSSSSSSSSSRVIRVEPDQRAVKWTRRLVEMCGLTSYCTVRILFFALPSFYDVSASLSLSLSLSLLPIYCCLLVCIL
jgi:hypothetical protein